MQATVVIPGALAVFLLAILTVSYMLYLRTVEVIEYML
jgi:hypothetical protein